MRFSTLLALLCVCLSRASAAAGVVDAPTWQVNDRWDVNKSYTLVFSDGNGGELTINTVETYRLTVSDIADRTTLLGNTFRVYRRVRSLGTISGTGTATGASGSLPIRWKSSSPTPTNTGESWTRVADLANVREQAALTGAIEGQIGFPLPIYSKLADVSFQSTTDLGPPTEELDFPIQTPGEAWSISPTSRSQGRIQVTWNPAFPWGAGGKPADIDQTFDETVVNASSFTFMGNAARLGFPSTYRVQSSSSANFYYEPSIKEYVEVVSPEIGEGGFIVQNFSEKLSNTVVAADPNITNFQFTPPKPPPGGFTLLSGTTTPNRTIKATILEEAWVGYATSTGSGAFSLLLRAPNHNDASPSSDDFGSFGVEVEVTGVGRKVVTLQLGPQSNAAGPSWLRY